MTSPSDDLSHLEITPTKIKNFGSFRQLTEAEMTAMEQKRIAREKRAAEARPRFELFLKELAELQERFGVALVPSGCGGCDGTIYAEMPDTVQSQWPLLIAEIGKEIQNG